MLCVLALSHSKLGLADPNLHSLFVFAGKQRTTLSGPREYCSWCCSAVQDGIDDGAAPKIGRVTNIGVWGEPSETPGCSVSAMPVSHTKLYQLCSRPAQMYLYDTQEACTAEGCSMPAAAILTGLFLLVVSGPPSAEVRPLHLGCASWFLSILVLDIGLCWTCSR